MTLITKVGHSSTFVEQQENEKRISYYNKTLKVLRSTTYIQFDISKLLSRADFQERNYSPTTLFNRLSVPAFATSPLQSIWLRCISSGTRMIYEFQDLSASDLSRCNYTFCRIIRENGQDALLHQLAAPSFSGKLAVTLVSNFMRMANIRNILLLDVSTLLSCCKEESATSLHVTEVMKTGKSWYAEQGATSNVTRFDLAQHSSTLVDEKYEDRVAKKKAIGGWTEDFDSLYSDCIASTFDEFTSKEAYEEAALFLYEITVNQLQQGILKDTFFYAEADYLQKILYRLSAATGFNPTMRLGSHVEEVMKHEEIHHFVHEVRDTVIGNSDSFLNSYLAESFEENEGIYSAKMCAYAFFVLDSVYKQSKFMPVRPVFSSLLHSSFNYRESSILDNFTEEAHESFFAMVENNQRPSTPISAKLLHHSNKESRRSWFGKNEELKFVDSSLFDGAIHYLGSLDFYKLQNSAPKGFQECLKRLSALSDIQGVETSKLRHHFLALPDGEETDIFMDQFMENAMKYLSSFAISFFKSYQQKRNDADTYGLFMLSKHLCKHRELFSFTTP